MIRLRKGTVRRLMGERPGVQELEVDIDGRAEPALAYPALTGPVAEGDDVLLNTTAVSYGLGTGGYHFVVSATGRSTLDPDPDGHVMKLRYTPLQAKVLTVEEQGSPHRGAFDGTPDLAGTPVVWAPLHSMLGAVCAGARAAGARRIVHVMTDGGALVSWFSRQLHTLRVAGFVDAVVTCGQALGGDLEAVNVLSGLLAARGVTGGDVLVVADGPGKVGTATRWGASDVASGMSLNAAGILGGRPVATLRLSFADPSYRHYGLSPHTVTVLGRVALVHAHVAVPVLEGDRREIVWGALKEAELEERHQLVEVAGDPALELLAERGVVAETMGRRLEDDREFFLAAGAAGVLAGRMAAGATRWEHEAPAP